VCGGYEKVDAINEKSREQKRTIKTAIHTNVKGVDQA
jgi:hypothetical protein